MQNKSAVIKFIEKERAEGTNDKDIQHHLLDAGWHMDIIQQAMQADLSSPIKETTPVKKSLDTRKMQLLGAAGTLLGLILFALFI